MLAVKTIQRGPTLCSWCKEEIQDSQWSRVGKHDLHDGCLGAAVLWALEEVACPSAEPHCAPLTLPLETPSEISANGNGHHAETPAGEAVGIPLTFDLPEEPKDGWHEWDQAGHDGGGHPPLPEPELRECTRCDQKFPPTQEHFSPNDRTADGLNNYCVQCEPKEAVPASARKKGGRPKKVEPVSSAFDGLQLSPEACGSRRVALGLTHDQLARSIKYLIGYGAIENFEKRITFISDRAMKALDEALSWMEVNGVPAELGRFVDAFTSEQRMARTP